MGKEIFLYKVVKELSAGVLYYKISEYAGLNSILLMETLNTTIQEKLHTNSSAFAYQLKRNNKRS